MKKWLIVGLVSAAIGYGGYFYANEYKPNCATKNGCTGCPCNLE